jgi:translation initiation factor IF-3
VKITIMFRGREVYHPELGKRILDRLAEQVEGTGKVESEARLDGRNMVMVLAPDKRARQSQAARSATHPDAAEGGPQVNGAGGVPAAAEAAQGGEAPGAVAAPPETSTTSGEG